MKGFVGALGITVIGAALLAGCGGGGSGDSNSGGGDSGTSTNAIAAQGVYFGSYTLKGTPGSVLTGLDFVDDLIK